ncbi:MAG TPA: hypothetical protein VD838_00945, partial [Anaeromyxobacteraceae bacterium]|nr:hypothetical protein [Anaeromyxobacteraceae bacterium]
MAWWAAAALGVQAVGALGSWNEGRKAKDLAKAENAEGLRRLELEQKAQFGSATARAGASDGIEFDSESTSAYLGEMAAEMRRQYEWQRRMGAQRAAAMGRQNRWNLFNQGAG